MIVLFLKQGTTPRAENYSYNSRKNRMNFLAGVWGGEYVDVVEIWHETRCIIRCNRFAQVVYMLLIATAILNNIICEQCLIIIH